MRFILPFILLSSLLLLGACDHPAGRQNITTADTTLNNQQYLLAATLFVQQSAEYNALCYQAYNIAKERITERLVNTRSGDKPLAVVLDLDETVLDNSAYTAWQIVNNRPFSYETWARWTALGAAPEVPGAGDFLNFANDQGVSLFYVSNRDTAALMPTMENMLQLGHPQIEAEHFLLKTSTSDKTDRRSEIEKLGYDVIMFIGDNLGDFDARYDRQSNDHRRSLTEKDRNLFGINWIVLPNPLYGTWEGAIYNFDRDLSETEKTNLRMKALISDQRISN